jgi:hypothetical protein
VLVEILLIVGGFGRTAAMVVRRLRPSIDPDGWSAGSAPDVTARSASGVEGG